MQLSSDALKVRIMFAIRDFPFHDYGMDDVEFITGNEWVTDLIDAIARKVEG